MLCAGKPAAYDALCQIFDGETQSGTDMSKYNTLLEAAVHSIARTFQRRLATGLMGNREFVIPRESEQPSETSQFDLVSWLVINRREG